MLNIEVQLEIMNLHIFGGGAGDTGVSDGGTGFGGGSVMHYVYLKKLQHNRYAR
jgi:hypothetical protein